MSVPPTDTGAPTAAASAGTRNGGLSERFVADVDARMLELVDRRDGVAVRGARAAIAAGGKRLRPLLVLAGRPMAASPDAYPWHVSAAAAVELVHTASLIHDDVLDGASMRRGRPTVASELGMHAAVAAGDLLFSLAFGALLECRASAGDETVHAAVTVLARAARTLAEGEAMQQMQHRDATLAIDAYLARCEGKTGVLFGAALQLGAVFGGACPADVRVLGCFGNEVGVAFQIADDVLDCADHAEARRLGKQPGADVLDGTVTLPLLIACERDPRVVAALDAIGRRDRVGDGSRDDSALPEVQRVLAMVRECGAIDAARDEALRRAAAALDLLEDLRDGFDAGLLRAVAGRSVQRVS